MMNAAGELAKLLDDQFGALRYDGDGDYWVNLNRSFTTPAELVAESEPNSEDGSAACVLGKRLRGPGRLLLATFRQPGFRDIAHMLIV